MSFVVPNLLAPLLEQGRPLPLPWDQVSEGAHSDLLLEDGFWIRIRSAGNRSRYLLLRCAVSGGDGSGTPAC